MSPPPHTHHVCGVPSVPLFIASSSYGKIPRLTRDDVSPFSHKSLLNFSYSTSGTAFQTRKMQNVST